MPEIQYPKNPNSDTAFVVQEDGTKNRALMTAPQDTSSLELPTNSNSCKGYVTVDGKKQRVILTADIGGGGSSLPDQDGHAGEFLTTDGTDTSWATVDALPDQTGQSGKFLTTDGTDASWSDKPLVNVATGSNSITIGGTATASGNAVNIGASSSTTGGQSVVVGQGARATANATVVIGQVASASGQEGIAIGNGASAAGGSAIQLGYGTNSTANTFKIRNYELMSADGTIPEARLADTTNAQQGDVLTLDSTGNAVWQAGGGGGLPTQTGNAGKFLTTDGTDASWGTISALVNETTGQNSLSILGSNRPSSSNMVAVGKFSGANSANFTTLIGYSAASRSNYGTAIGSNAAVGLNANYAIQLGANGTNSDANTFKVANENGNFEIMSADGTVPTARLTKVNTTATLAVADWSSNTQTVTVSGVKADSVVFVSPAPASASDYASAGILCTAQAADSLTFTCTTTPTNAITVNVVCM